MLPAMLPCTPDDKTLDCTRRSGPLLMYQCVGLQYVHIAPPPRIITSNQLTHALARPCPARVTPPLLHSFTNSLTHAVLERLSKHQPCQEARSPRYPRRGTASKALAALL